MKSLGQQVVRGMGSGLPINQQMAGASNPREAAAMAANPDVSAIEEKQQQAENVDRKLEILKEAMDRGFKTSFTEKEIEESSEILSRVFKDYEEWEAKKIDEDLEFEYNIPADDPLYDPIRDTSRRKRIEKALKPLDFESMIFKGYCSQVIPIRENFNITFRTLNTNQSLWIESMTLQLQEKSVQYGRHWMSLVQIAVCLESINGKELTPNIYKFSKTSQEDDFRTALDARMEYVGQLPQVFTDDLIIQYAWFSARVRKLMSGDFVEKLGN